MHPRITIDEPQTPLYRPKPYLVQVFGGKVCYEARYETAEEAADYVRRCHQAGCRPPDCTIVTTRSEFVFDVPEAGQ